MHDIMGDYYFSSTQERYVGSFDNGQLTGHGT